MKTAEVLYHELVAYCEANADEQIVKKYSRYFKEGYDAYGLTTVIFENKVNELKAQPDFTLPLVLETAPLLMKSGKYEEASFAIILLWQKKKEFTPATFEQIDRWFAIGITNWAHCDVLCSETLPYFFIEKIVLPEKLAEWQNSPYRFQRRAIPVTSIKMLKSGFELQTLLQFVEPLMLDKEKVVHQGLGWFLREAWKKYPIETEVFLYRWKKHSARLIFQYATEKMDKDQKSRFKKE